MKRERALERARELLRQGYSGFAYLIGPDYMVFRNYPNLPPPTYSGVQRGYKTTVREFWPTLEQFMESAK